MKARLPVYVEEQRDATPSFEARPLFIADLRRSGGQLQRVLERLAEDMRRHLQALGRQPRHDDLVRQLFAPLTEERRLDMELILRRRTLRGRLLFVTFEALGRRIAFTPALPKLWFEIGTGHTLHHRAHEVLTEHFRRIEKEQGPDALPEQIGVTGRCWVTTVDLTFQLRRSFKPPKLDLAALFGGPSIGSGFDELHRVGLCLNRLYPDELGRAVLRDEQVHEIDRLLSDEARRPVVLLGRQKVGKTAVIHEHLFRKLKPLRHPANAPQAIWHLSPQRLISGMMYVGQWEQRLLAILDHARRKDLVLYFDDLLGLHLAGISSQSDVTVAHVLKPAIEKREVRVLAEATPEAWRKLQEIDRGLCDLFHIVPVDEPTPTHTRRILIDVVRRTESRERCEFDIDVLPTAVELYERYAREQAFPGKAATFLERLGQKHAGKPIPRHVALEEYHLTSGLSVSFLDDHTRLDRDEVCAALRERVIGQPTAVSAMADVVGLAKARLNDPARPLASLLFMGPTGVGKTESAKALAAYLFGDAERLVRFDLNSLVDAAAVPRLVGTLVEPEGLLTSAIRRQPFCVLLLDEVEKAHPDVFDLLLQVLGEGRLTDSLGRTADFTNTIIILTSNLGVTEASSRYGFAGRAGDARTEHAIYENAARAFFRPEFFNRLDRVAPFSRLGRQDVETIARRLIGEVFQREGLTRRRSVLRVSPAAMAAIVEHGYDPLQGARALKRSVERGFTSPVAAAVAEKRPGSPLVINVRHGDTELTVEASELVSAAAHPWPPASLRQITGDDLAERAMDVLDRIAAQLDERRPPGPTSASRLTGEQVMYFGLKEQLRAARGRVAAVTRTDRPPIVHVRGTGHMPPRRFRPSQSSAEPQRVRWAPAPPHVWHDLFAADDVQLYVKELVRSIAAADDEAIDQRVMDLLNDLALLEAMCGTGNEATGHTRVLMQIRGLAGGVDRSATYLHALYAGVFNAPWALEAKNPANGPSPADDLCGEGLEKGDCLLLIEGLLAGRLASIETGTHLVVSDSGSIVPVQVRSIPILVDVSAEQAVRRLARSAELLAGDGEADEWPVGPVLRIYDPHRLSIDLRTGLMTRGRPEVSDIATFVLSQLPLPEELRQAMRHDESDEPDQTGVSS